MSDYTPFHQVLRERITNPSANYRTAPWCDAEVKQFTIDMNELIRFIEKECADEKLCYLNKSLTLSWRRPAARSS